MVAAPKQLPPAMMEVLKLMESSGLLPPALLQQTNQSFEQGRGIPFLMMEKMSELDRKGMLPANMMTLLLLLQKAALGHMQRGEAAGVAAGAKAGAAADAADPQDLEDGGEVTVGAEPAKAKGQWSKGEAEPSPPQPFLWTGP